MIKNINIENLTIGSVKNYGNFFSLNLSIGLYMKTNVSKAEELQKKISDLSEDSIEKVDILIELSKMYLGRSPSKVLELGKQALKLSKKLNYEKGIAISLNIIGISYSLLSDYDLAIEYYHESLKISEKLNFKNIIAVTINNIGIIYTDLKNYKKAIEYYYRALKIFKENKDMINIADATNNIGIIYSRLKDFDKALQFGTESLELYKKVGRSRDVIQSYINIGNLYEANNNPKKALEYYYKTLKISKEIKESDVTVIVLNNISRIKISTGKYKKAQQYLEEALKIAQKIKSRKLIMNIYENLSNLYTATKDFERSLKYYKLYTKIKDEIFNKASSDKIAELQAKYEIEKKENEIEKKEKEIAFLHKENELYKIQLEAKLKLEKAHLEIEQKNETINLISRELENLIEKDFIGTSEAIKSVLNIAFTAAKNKDTHVLITGESGTGKEIIARIIHHSSDRKKGPFLPVNCTAIPETLLESEFFGHRKGAFTGAIENKKGLFELADNGTLFLDEIADMSFSLQAKLLRVIEEKKIKRIGENKEIPLNVRMISATNRNIKELIENKDFRLDLYYRINTLEINIPPLRERTKDIEPLIQHFAKFFAEKTNRQIPEISKDLIIKLKKYYFPGNVRELKNLVERAVILSKNNFLDVSDFHVTNPEIRSRPSGEKNIYNDEVNRIKDALLATNFHQNKAAEILGIPRITLIRKMKKYNINIKKVIE
ncbi:MAG: sigma 54-interacting transcriptional regulator [Candidatus Cloacimonetes bacterium]|nr:sigma 54-interacting transcriptional regulator [Candidatus Cloacimonadota bacterium]